MADSGRDALRFALLAGPAEPLRLAPSRETLEDPLYFLQYTHARACALLRLAADGPASASVEQPAQGRELLVALALYADRLGAAAAARAPWRLRHTLADVAVAFHRFVIANRPGDASSSSGYWTLVEGTRRVLAHGLETVLGLPAPAEL